MGLKSASVTSAGGLRPQIAFYFSGQPTDSVASQVYLVTLLNALHCVLKTRDGG